MKLHNIGEEVYIARYGAEETLETCPDCFGDRRLTVILGDSSTVSIECAGCTRGYIPSTGKIRVVKHSAKVEHKAVTGIDTERWGNSNGVRYSFTGRSAEECDVFATREEAEARAEEIAKERDKLERERVFKKDKHHETWAWHVTYHRGRIKDAKRELAYHTEKLEAAKAKAKS